MRFGRFVLVSATAVACAQIAGLDDPGEAPVGLPDATAPDGTSVENDGGGGTPDAPNDGSVVDADGAVDAGVCKDAIFCEDFDTDASVAQWTKQDSGTGSVQLVTNPVRSPPRAMRAVNSGSGNAQLARIVPITDAIACEMSVRVSAWSGEAYFFELGLDPADKGGFSYWWLDVGKQAGKAIYLEYSFDGNNTTNTFGEWAPPPANTWFRVRVEVRLRGGAPTARVFYDGVEKLVRNLAVPASTTYVLAIGIGTDKSVTADDVVIDDVVCHAM